jgi:hypothetical protein
LRIAVQVAFEKKQRLETRFSLHRLKGWVTVTRRFQAMGLTNGFNLYSPAVARANLQLHRMTSRRGGVLILLDVALQVAFERQKLKPVFHLIGYRLWV